MRVSALHVLDFFDDVADHLFLLKYYLVELCRLRAQAFVNGCYLWQVHHLLCALDQLFHELSGDYCWELFEDVWPVLQFDEAACKRRQLSVVQHLVQGGLDLFDLQVEDELSVEEVFVVKSVFEQVG